MNFGGNASNGAQVTISTVHTTHTDRVFLSPSGGNRVAVCRADNGPCNRVVVHNNGGPGCRTSSVTTTYSALRRFSLPRRLIISFDRNGYRGRRHHRLRIYRSVYRRVHGNSATVTKVVTRDFLHRKARGVINNRPLACNRSVASPYLN